MVFSERTYSALMVSASNKFNEVFRPILIQGGCHPIGIVGSVSAARQALSERSYDFVFINTPLGDEMGTRFAAEAAARSDCVVLLLVAADKYEQISSGVIAKGVFPLPKPFPAKTINQALDWMAAARERLRSIETKSASLEEKMEEIRLVNRAKWLLISELKMTENEAHRYIEKQSMDSCVSRRQVASEIIKTYS